MPAHQFSGLAVHHKEVIEHSIEGSAVVETNWTNGFTLVILHVIQKMESVRIRVVGIRFEADAAIDRRRVAVYTHGALGDAR